MIEKDFEEFKKCFINEALNFQEIDHSIFHLLLLLLVFV